MGYDDDRIRHKNEKWLRNKEFRVKTDFLKVMERLVLRTEDWSANNIFVDLTDILYESNDVREEWRKCSRDYLIDADPEELGTE